MENGEAPLVGAMFLRHGGSYAGLASASMRDLPVSCRGRMGEPRVPGACYQAQGGTMQQEASSGVVIQMVAIDEATQTPTPKELALQPGRPVITKL